MPLQGALISVLAVAASCLAATAAFSFPKNFLVVTLNDCTYAGHTAVADLQCVTVENLP